MPKFKSIAIHGLQTLPRDGKSAEYFPQNHGASVFTEPLAATHPPRKNLALPHEKLRAFSLPQDSQVELMFGAARFGGPSLTTSRSLDFASRRADVVGRIASAHRTSASISTGFSTRPDVSPRDAV